MRIEYNTKFTALDSEEKPVQCSCGKPSERIALVRGGMWASCEECYTRNPESGIFLPSGTDDNPISYQLRG